VWDEGGEVSLGGHKPRALLAVLLLHPNEVVPADRLIDELWGEDSPERAHAALRVNISRLRKALSQDVLTTRSPGYAIRVDPDELDLHRFERLVDLPHRPREGSELDGGSSGGVGSLPPRDPVPERAGGDPGAFRGRAVEGSGPDVGTSACDPVASFSPPGVPRWQWPCPDTEPSGYDEDADHSERVSVAVEVVTALRKGGHVICHGLRPEEERALEQGPG